MKVITRNSYTLAAQLSSSNNTLRKLLLNIDTNAKAWTWLGSERWVLGATFEENLHFTNTTKAGIVSTSTAHTTPTMCSDVFVYQSLDHAHQSIRLLAITAKPDGDVSYHLLQDVRLSSPNCPKYIALSYTWGPPTPTQEIQVDGKTITIRQNLYDFLQLFRPGNALLGSAALEFIAYFWIDQICINQSSTIEKNHQVGMMAEMYKSSSRVEVWLGPGNSSSDLAMRYFCTLDKGVPSFTEDLEEISDFVDVVPEVYTNSWGFGPMDLARYRYDGGLKDFEGLSNVLVKSLMVEMNSSIHCRLLRDPLEARIWYRPKSNLLLAFKELLARPYWRRLWILQEVMLTRRVTITCRKFSVPSDSFESICMLGGDTIQAIFYGQHMALSMFLEIVNSFCDSECQDPRDKIYGLRAIMMAHYQDRLPVDYNKSVEEIYIEGIIMILGELGETEGFTYIGVDGSHFKACETLGRNMKPRAENRVLERLHEFGLGGLDHAKLSWSKRDRGTLAA